MNITPPPTTALAPPPHPRPPGFVAHRFENNFTVAAPRARVWDWLEDPDTFIRGQVFPYRVEFVPPAPGEPTGFRVGGLNIHHGPLLCLPGVLTEIREGSYRDLHYLYGSYVGSLRWVRPTRLTFEVSDDAQGGTLVQLTLESHVHRRLPRLWTVAQKFFWSRFPRWMSRSVGVA